MIHRWISICLLIATVSACSSLPHVVEPQPGESTIVDGDIYIVSHGWHTGVVLPAKAIQSRIPELYQRFKSAPYLEFGWGDKGFYQSKEISSGLTMQAIFWPTESVMHVVAVPVKAPKFFPHSQIQQICISDIEYASLLKFIDNSFARNEDGEVIGLTNGIYGDSQFYEGVGDYYLMNTCNKWTAKALKSAGLDIWPTFKLTAGSVMDYLDDSERVVMQGRCE